MEGHGRWSDIGRPGSRRGVSDRISPIMAKPSPSGRVGTATRLTTTISTAGGSLPPKTASRIGTAMNRANQNIMERPITQQGISGLSTSSGSSGMSRQIQDRRYWEGVLQLKMRELQDEILRLQTLSESANREQSARRHYDRKVKQVATELTELQGKLTDCNMVMEKMSSGVSRNQVDAETKSLREQNEELQANVEHLFEQKQKAEESVQQLEKEIEKENKNINLLINSMSSEERETYMHLQESSRDLQNQANDLQTQLELVAKERDHLHVQISGSQTRQDAVRLLQRIRESENRKTQLKTELANKLTPTQEREKLLLQVREDNASVATLDRQTNVLKEEIVKKKQLLEQAEQDLEEGRSDRHQKYIELRRRDEAMEEYLQAFPTAFEQETARLEKLEATVVFCLEHSSLGVFGDVTEPTTSGKQLTTEDGLRQEFSQLSNNLIKVEALEQKMQSELSQLKETEAKLKKEIHVVSDILSLKEKHAEHVQELVREKESLKQKKEPTKNAVKEAQRKYDELKQNLEGNEMYTELKSLEDKVLNLDSSITELQGNVATAQSGALYEDVQGSALEALNKYNDMLNASVPQKTYPSAL